eukprot:5948301-Pleurochrysis_carterae.AAC.1
MARIGSKRIAPLQIGLKRQRAQQCVALHHCHHHPEWFEMSVMQLAEMGGQRGAAGFQQFSEQNGTSRLEHELRGTCIP